MKVLQLVILLVLFFSGKHPQELPAEFVYLKEISSDILVDLRYNSADNFMGRKIDGYYSKSCILTRKAAMALKKVHKELESKGLSLKIFDAYRPQRAVDHFVRWAQDLSDTLNKTSYYPEVLKSELFKRGYIAAKSGHTRGSTLDLTIVKSSNNTELDMGTSWDFFSEKSWPQSNEVTRAQKDNRMLLRTVMIKFGFKPYEAEWWHFTLNKEPFPDTYFDFPVK